MTWAPGPGRWAGAAGPGRWAGAAVAGTLALALLVGGCVFAALAGPAFSLHTRTQALHQTLAGLAGTDETVQMTALWADFTNPNEFAVNPLAQGQGLTPADVATATSELGGGLAGLRLPLAGGGWAGLTTRLFPAGLGAPPPGGAPGEVPVSLEVAYRYPLAGHAQVVAGSYGSPVPAGAVGVAATAQTADVLGLHPGSSLRLFTRPAPPPSSSPRSSPSVTPARPSGPWTRPSPCRRSMSRSRARRSGRAGCSPTPAISARCRRRSASPA